MIPHARSACMARPWRVAPITPFGSTLTAVQQAWNYAQLGGSSACRIVERITQRDGLSGRWTPPLSWHGHVAGDAWWWCGMAEVGAGADEVAANRELWTQVNTEYADEHAYRAWGAEDCPRS
jgi:hypothetical protein